MPERSRGWSGQSTRSDERRTDELAAIGMVTGAAAISTAPTMTFKGRRDRTGSSSYAAGHRNTWPRSLERSRQTHRLLAPHANAVFPLIGALVDVYLLSKRDSAALMLGGGWLVIGVVYLLLLTRGLRVRLPEMSLVE